MFYCVPNFNINEIQLDEKYVDKQYKTTTVYFIAPKAWLGKSYPEAIHSEISIEYPTSHPEPEYVSVMMSPTREDSEGDSIDYDWFDVDLLPREISALLDLAFTA